MIKKIVRFFLPPAGRRTGAVESYDFLRNRRRTVPVDDLWPKLMSAICPRKYDYVNWQPWYDIINDKNGERKHTIFSVLGAGKTYTMLGTDDDPGIMARTLNDLFISMDNTREDMKYKVTLSYLEVSRSRSS